MDVHEDSFDAQSRVYAEQISHLYSHTKLTFIVTFLNGSLLVLVLWPYIQHTVIVSWFVALSVVTICRGLLAAHFSREISLSSSIRTWHYAYLIGAGLSGIVWGSAALFLFAAGTFEAQMLLIMVLAGMTAAATSVLSARMETFLAFALPTLSPLAGQLIIQGGTLSVTMAGLTVIFMIGMTVVARAMHQTLKTSFELRFDNRNLIKEIERRHQTEEALFQEKDRLQITLEALSEGVVITGADATIKYLNPAAERLCGWSNEDSIGNSIENLFPMLEEHTGEKSSCALITCLQTVNRVEKNILLHTRHGQDQIIEEIATPLKNRAGKVSGAVTVMRDVTEARKHRQELVFQANHDLLTQLPTRALLMDRLKHSISRAQRACHLVALLFMDLDRFKNVNDSLGHAAGDALLNLVAQRLTKGVRDEDTVARLGGDEFVVLVEEIQQPNAVAITARKLIDLLGTPFLVENHAISVTASIGITLFPKDGDNPETLLKNADTAMYRAKELGRNNIQFYAEEMNIRALHRLKLEQALRYAVARDEFILNYQPQIELASGKIVAVEALVRWERPDYGKVFPDDFIPIAEESGAIVEIGNWVLTQACAQLRAWQMNGHEDLRISVNLSVRQLHQHDLTKIIEKALAYSDLPPKYLELEITESLFLNDTEETLDLLQSIKKLGVTLAIDDFGTGYSSLSYLKYFPIDTIKIDKSFIDKVHENNSNAAIVSAIIQMGHGLNLSVIGEGVENQAQFEFLKNRNIDAFQGYKFSKALSTTQMTDLLQKTSSVTRPIDDCSN